MKWLLAAVALSASMAAAASRLARIKRHRERGGPMMRRRIYGSMGVALGSLGWAAAVLNLVGVVRRGGAFDWALLGLADVASFLMAYSLWRADRQDTAGGGVSQRQAQALAEFDRIKRGLPPLED